MAIKSNNNFSHKLLRRVFATVAAAGALGLGTVAGTALPLLTDTDNAADAARVFASDILGDKSYRKAAKAHILSQCSETDKVLNGTYASDLLVRAFMDDVDCIEKKSDAVSDMVFEMKLAALPSAGFSAAGVLLGGLVLTSRKKRPTL